MLYSHERRCMAWSESDPNAAARRDVPFSSKLFNRVKFPAIATGQLHGKFEKVEKFQ